VAYTPEPEVSGGILVLYKPAPLIKVPTKGGTLKKEEGRKE